MQRTGYDMGSQYASVIYYYDEEQKQIAEAVKQDFQLKVDKQLIRYSEKTVMTDIRHATTFYQAESEHQAYLDNNPGGYCNHFYRTDEYRV